VWDVKPVPERVLEMGRTGNPALAGSVAGE
jgi:hypothetical protein